MITLTKFMKMPMMRYLARPVKALVKARSALARPSWREDWISID